MSIDAFYRKVKPCAMSSLYYLGFFDVLRTLQRNRLSILMYHRFSAGPEPFKLSQKVFEKQLEFLHKKYNFINFGDYLYSLNGEGGSLPLNPLLVTIDDGFLDNYEIAYPLLKKYNVPAMIFLTTDFISQKTWLWPNQLEYILKNSARTDFSFPLGANFGSFQVDSFAGWHKAQLKIFNYCRSLENNDKNLLLEQLAHYLEVQVPTVVTEDFLPLTWNQIREMHSSGIEFGSHSCSHPICSRLSVEALTTELTESKVEIEKNISAQVDVFCFPNGQPEDYSEMVVEEVKKQGYRAAVTTVVGFNDLDKSDPLRLKRLSFGTDIPATMSRALTR